MTKTNTKTLVERLRELPLKKRIEGLESYLEAQEKRIAELEGELAKCHGNNLAGNPYEWSHQALIDGLGGQLTAEIAENLSLKDKVQELEENESGRYREVESLAARVEYIEIENDGLHKHIQELHSENAALKDRIRELEKVP